MDQLEDENKIIVGPKSTYEPTRGGVGYEVFKALERYSNDTALCIVETGQTCTYGSLLQRSKKVAQHLTKYYTFNKEDVICLCSSNSFNSNLPLFASLFLNIRYASLEPTMSEEDLQYIIECLKPKCMFVAEDVVEKIESCLKNANIKTELIILGKSKKYNQLEDIIEETPEDDKFKPVIIDDLMETALLIFSSGTSGKPKGVCINHYSILGQICNATPMWFIDEERQAQGRSLTYTPMYWISGLYFVIMDTLRGSVRISGATFDSTTAWEVIKKYKPTCMFLAPGQLAELYVNRGNESYDGMELFITGGGPVKSYHLDYIKEMFPKSVPASIYGLTETAGMVSAFSIYETKLQEKYPNSCGKVSPGVLVKIVNEETGQLCGINEEGELRVKTKYKMNGYYNLETSTAYDSQGFFKTGDLAYFNEEKCLTIIDRIKELLLYKIHNITPSAIEDILQLHPAVHKSFVIGIPHVTDNQHPMGVVVLKKEYINNTTPQEIVDFVNERVSADKYKIRAGVKVVDEFLTTPSGKIKKLKMKELIIKGEI